MWTNVMRSAAITLRGRNLHDEVKLFENELSTVTFFILHVN